MSDTSATFAPPSAPPAQAVEETALLAPLYPLPRIELVEGEGCRVKDANGNEYLDFASGIAVNALGHAPRVLAEAVSKQMEALVHCSNYFANRPAIELAERLCAATGYDRVFLCNSGTEGVEAALKFARVHAAKRDLPTGILAFKGGFHGRTGFALSATWTPAYREPFEPLIPVRFADFNDVAALDDALDASITTVIVEPVQGEGGAIPATADFLHALRARTSALGATLIFDEVQCGMARTGHLLAAQHYGVEADVTVLSKALGGGLPVAAVLLRRTVADSLAPGMHGTTFGGGPVAATAANVVLAHVTDAAFLASVRRMSRVLETGLTDLVASSSALSASRGLGLLRAVVLSDAAKFEPMDVVKAARKQGLLLVPAGGRSVRFLPPLNVSGADIASAIDRFAAALHQLEQETEA